MVSLAFIIAVRGGPLRKDDKFKSEGKAPANRNRWGQNLEKLK
jgi:hypothetical protein